jgi:uncharacterized protein YukJ
MNYKKLKKALKRVQKEMDNIKSYSGIVVRHNDNEYQITLETWDDDSNQDEYFETIEEFINKLKRNYER